MLNRASLLPVSSYYKKRDWKSKVKVLCVPEAVCASFVLRSRFTLCGVISRHSVRVLALRANDTIVEAFVQFDAVTRP